MSCIISIIAAVVTLNCETPRPTPAEAAHVLAQASSLSNRTNVYTPTTEDLRRVVFVPTPAPVRQVERRMETSRSIRMGIPGGWTPLEWAILHGGSR